MQTTLLHFARARSICKLNVPEAADIQPNKSGLRVQDLNAGPIALGLSLSPYLTMCVTDCDPPRNNWHGRPAGYRSAVPVGITRAQSRTK